MNDIIGKKVYSGKGIKIGKINEVILSGFQVYGWLVQVDEKYGLKKRVLIKRENVKVVKEIVIVDNEIEKLLNKLENEVNFTGDF